MHNAKISEKLEIEAWDQQSKKKRPMYFDCSIFIKPVFHFLLVILRVRRTLSMPEDTKHARIHGQTKSKWYFMDDII